MQQGPVLSELLHMSSYSFRLYEKSLCMTLLHPTPVLTEFQEMMTSVSKEAVVIGSFQISLNFA